MIHLYNDIFNISVVTFQKNTPKLDFGATVLATYGRVFQISVNECFGHVL